jgi:hypothetical protein
MNDKTLRVLSLVAAVLALAISTQPAFALTAPLGSTKGSVVTNNNDPDKLIFLPEVGDEVALKHRG